MVCCIVACIDPIAVTSDASDRLGSPCTRFLLPDSMGLELEIAACFQGLGDKILNNSGTTHFLFTCQFVNGIHELSWKCNGGGWRAACWWSSYPLFVG